MKRKQIKVMPFFWRRHGGFLLPVAGVAILWAFCVPSPSWSAENETKRAARYYGWASQLLTDLQKVPEPELGIKQYLLVAKAFRRVYRTSPISSYCDESLLHEANIYRKIAARFGSEKRRRDAIKTYNFLIREYPHSKLKPEALDAIAEISTGQNSHLSPDKSFLTMKSDGSHAKRVASKNKVKSAKATLEIENLVIAPSPASRESDLLRHIGDGVPLVEDIRSWSHPSATRIVIDVDAQVKYRFERLQNPERLFIDLLKSRVGPKFSNRRTAVFSVGDDRVRQIRVAQNRKSTVRVVLDLNQFVHADFQRLTNPARLVIELRSKTDQMLLAEKSLPAHNGGTVYGGVLTAQASSGTEPTATLTDKTLSDLPSRFEFQAPFLQEPMSVNSLPQLTPPAIDSLSGIETTDQFLSSMALADGDWNVRYPPKGAMVGVSPLLRKPVSSELVRAPKEASATSRGKRNMIRALGLKVSRVVIDAGHGGHDTGTIGKGGLREKDLVVDISRRLGELIQTHLGADVIYTRSTDRFVSLKERTKLANDSKADLFVSVHANSSKLRSIRGVETYYLSLTTNPSALGVASRENAAAQRSIHELENLLSKIALTEKIEESREFAGKIQKSLYGGLARKTKGLSDRGVRKAPFMVLVGAKMPAVLAEVGFLSNPKDEKLLKSSSYRQNIAKHLFEGVSAYADTLSKVALTKGASVTESGVD